MNLLKQARAASLDVLRFSRGFFAFHRLRPHDHLVCGYYIRFVAYNLLVIPMPHSCLRSRPHPSWSWMSRITDFQRTRNQVRLRHCRYLPLHHSPLALPDSCSLPR
ncbi:hypothetical protein M413DRAFT_345660 [Hebeloma cylindrosporum]|uniref:Uncharacterized protein n=1 Tax=Hebeloma cylindrosporum TaxID=76867 RepID=A0A0C3CPG4_HEBCY|nr:hypothetical protein M413DRAFT_345660 [Hebeloma cylindrosporum h7]